MNEIKIQPASIEDYEIIQNMAKFYVYDLSRFCGHSSKGWSMEPNGEYKSFELKDYFLNPEKKAFLIRLRDDGELVGFVLLNKHGTTNIDWNVGEFFVLARFQGRGIADYVAKWIFLQHPGSWEVSVIPENIPALKFWERIIWHVTAGEFKKSIKNIDYDLDQPNRIIFEFKVNFFIKAATNQDHFEIANVSIKSWRDTYQDIMPREFLDSLTPEFKVYNREYWYSLQNKFCLVAVLNNKIIGFCDYGDSRHLKYGNGEIYALYILPEFKSFKIGERIVQAAIDSLKTKGYDSFVVTTIEKNLSARKFYEKFGFTACGSVNTKIGNNYYPEIIYAINHL